MEIMANLKKPLPLSPLDCLVKQIDPGCFAEELLAEQKEFLGDTTSRSEEYYVELLKEEPWKIFKSRIQQDDELWFFRFPPPYWERLHGCQGYAVIRKGKLIEKIITIRN